MLYRDYLKDKYQNAAVKLANAEGVPCVLEYSKGKNIRNYEVYGNSVQDGTPSPESPVEIQSVGDLTKNLINESDIKLSSGYWSDIDGHMIGNNSRFIGISPIKCNPNEKYTLSSNLEIYTIWFFNNNTPISKVYRVNKVVVFMTPENCNNLRISLVNTSGNTDTIAFKWIQLELGTTATEYEPYGYKIPIVNSGKNLLSYPYNFTTRTENGLTFTDNGDGSITINGTATIQTGFIFRNQIIDAIDKAKAYVLSGGEDGNVVLRIDFYNGTTWKNLVNTGNDGKAIIDFTKMNFDYTRVSVALVVKANTVCDNITIKPQLELGETATEYEPYRVPVTANIYLDEPLRKIGDYADYIDFKGQRVVRKVGVLDNTSTKPISESLVALAIPTEEPIPLPALKTFKGTNIISVDTSVQPSNIKAKYVRL